MLVRCSLVAVANPAAPFQHFQRRPAHTAFLGTPWGGLNPLFDLLKHISSATMEDGDRLAGSENLESFWDGSFEAQDGPDDWIIEPSVTLKLVAAEIDRLLSLRAQCGHTPVEGTPVGPVGEQVAPSGGAVNPELLVFRCERHGANQSHDTPDCRGLNNNLGASAGTEGAPSKPVPGGDAHVRTSSRSKDGKDAKAGQATMQLADYMASHALKQVQQQGGPADAKVSRLNDPLRILVLGCGTSRLSEMIHSQHSEQITLTSTDISVRGRCAACGLCMLNSVPLDHRQ